MLELVLALIALFLIILMWPVVWRLAVGALGLMVLLVLIGLAI